MASENSLPIDLTTKKIKRRRSSFFNLKVEKPDNQNIAEEQKKYIESLKAEQKDWIVAIRECQKQTKALASKPPSEHDISCLSKERQSYMSQAINLETLVSDLEKFQKLVIRHIMRKEFIGKRIKDCQDQIDGELMKVAILKLSQ